MSETSKDERTYVQKTDDKSALVKASGFRSAIIGGLKFGAITLPTGLLLNKYYKPFRSLSASAKTGLIITLPVLGFAFSGEHRTAKMANPQLFMNNEKVEREDEHLAYWKQGANFVHDHPFRTIIFTGVPTVSAIFIARSGSELKLMQRILHARVLGQFSVLILVGTIMMFHDYMDRRGPYLE